MPQEGDEDLRFDSASVWVPLMNEVTRVLSAIEGGDPRAAEQLLPLVYEELRRLAAQKLAQEKPGQTLEATALVHEAYLRLVGGEQTRGWDGRGHFFAAAAEAMRRILIDRARHKQTRKAGGGHRRLDLDDIEPALEALEEENGDRLSTLGLRTGVVAQRAVEGDVAPAGSRRVAGQRVFVPHEKTRQATSH